MVDATARRRSGRRIGTLAAARWRRPGGVAWASRRVGEGVRAGTAGATPRRPRTPGQDVRDDVMNGVRSWHQPSSPRTLLRLGLPEPTAVETDAQGEPV